MTVVHNSEGGFMEGSKGALDLFRNFLVQATIALISATKQNKQQISVLNDTFQYQKLSEDFKCVTFRFDLC